MSETPETPETPNPPVKIKMGEVSILESVKKVLGFTREYDAFDMDIVLAINSTFATLQQLKVGGDEVFEIEGYEEVWSDFTTDKVLSMVRTYICDKVRMVFDPPQHGPTINAINERIKEHEFRLNVAAERTGYE